MTTGDAITSTVDPVAARSSGGPVLINEGSIGGLTLSDDACHRVLDAVGARRSNIELAVSSDKALAIIRCTFNLMMVLYTPSRQVLKKAVRSISTQFKKLEAERDENERVKRMEYLIHYMEPFRWVSDPPYYGGPLNADWLRRWIEDHAGHAEGCSPLGRPPAYGMDQTLQYAMGAFELIYRRAACDTEDGPTARFVQAILAEGRVALNRRDHAFADKTYAKITRHAWGERDWPTLRKQMLEAMSARGRTNPTTLPSVNPLPARTPQDDGLGDCPVAAKRLMLAQNLHHLRLDISLP